MIAFRCLCGKKYQLPDRNAGRVVRCNQCERSLRVPEKSQEEPVVPIDIDEAAQNESPAGPQAEHPPSPGPEASPPAPEVPPPAAVSTPSLDMVSKSEPVNPPTVARVGKPAVAPVVQPVVQPEPPRPTRPEASTPAPPVVPAVKETVPIEAVPAVISAPGTVVPATVPAAVQPRTAQVSSAGGDTKTSLLLFTGSLLGGGLLGLLIAGAIIGYLSITHVPPGTVPDGGASTVVLSPSSPAKPAVGTLDHVLIDRDIRRFAFVSAPDTELRLSSDGNPMQAKDDASAALDDLSAVLQAEGSVSMEPHDVSLKIEAKGKGTFALSRTLGENGDCTTDSIDAIRLCLLMPETANANVDAATYGDPPGPFELAEFRLRLGQGSDYIELSPKSFSDFAVRHARARQNWIDLTIPVAGDDQWAVAGSSQKPRQIQWIELRGKPSGSAVTFWIDNLKLTGK